MAEPELCIAALQQAPGSIEIVAYGKVRRPTGDAQETEIQIFATSLTNTGKLTGSPKSYWIGCGQFDLVPIGSRWAKGVRYGERPMERTYSYSAKVVGLEPTGIWAASFEDGQPCTSPYQHDGNSEALCFKFRFEMPAGSEAADAPRIKVALVPLMELLRAAYCVSDVITKRMFDGLRDSQILPERALYDDKRSAFSATERKATLWCHRRLTRDELMVAAGLLAGGRFRASHDKVNKHLGNSPEWRQQQAVYASTISPFETANMSFQGYASDKDRGRLALT